MDRQRKQKRKKRKNTGIHNTCRKTNGKKRKKRKERWSKEIQIMSTINQLNIF